MGRFASPEVVRAHRTCTGGSIALTAGRGRQLDRHTGYRSNNMVLADGAVLTKAKM